MLVGLDVLSVQEVIRHRGLVPVPLSSSDVSGLLNLRGQIVTALDLRSLFGFEPRPADDNTMLVIVRSDHGPVGLMVDSVGDVIEIEESSLEPIPTSLPEKIAPLLRGVHKLPSAILHVLDDAAVCAVSTND